MAADDWDGWGDGGSKRIATLHADDTLTGERLATVNGLRGDHEVSKLLECVARQAGLPCKPRLLYNGTALKPWDKLEDVGLTDAAEIKAETFQALVTASHDGTAKIWNIDVGECEMTLHGHSGKVLAALFSPNSRLVATCSEDHTAKLWSVVTGNCERTMEHSDVVYSVSFSQDGKFLVTASEDKTAKVWIVKTGDCRATMRGHSAAVYSAHFTPDGTSVITASRDGTTKIWNPKTGICDRTLEEQETVYAGSFSPDGLSLATTPGDCTATILSVETGKRQLTLLGHTDLVMTADYARQRDPPLDKTVLPSK
mmetsp:Transcript_114642/g.220921  ORF Transcript_114642/g.220921 Transcript_114642/m.220921 type:complete len:312 (+) Transcript_114642:94-1029(+)